VIVEVGAHPESRVHNSQPHGIGRVVALGGLWAWNNLGRNVVFADEHFGPRAVFDESLFSEDEPSQYDLDVHAIAEVPSLGIIVMLNHLGIVRAFSSDAVREPGAPRRVDPIWTRTFAPDVERMVVLGDRIVGSRPREDGAPGLLIGERLSTQATPAPLQTTVHLETIGLVTALVAMDDRGTECIAVGSNGQLRLVPATAAGAGRPSWTVDLDFEPRIVLWDGARVWAAGSDRVAHAVDDYDWEALRGGGFAGVDPADGRVVVRGRFTEDLAWGNGGTAAVCVPGALCGIGRRGEVYTYDTTDGSLRTTSPAIADASLGIAHASALGDQILYGFNRGGYRLHSARIPHRA
jgi:hypothetical protein